MMWFIATCNHKIVTTSVNINILFQLYPTVFSSYKYGYIHLPRFNCKCPIIIRFNSRTLTSDCYTVVFKFKTS